LSGTSVSSGSASAEPKKPRRNRKLLATIAIVVAIALILPLAYYFFIMPEKEGETETLDPKSIPMFVNELTGPPPTYVPEIVNNSGVLSYEYRVNMSRFYEQILPAPLPMTEVWGYGGQAKDAVTGTLLGFVRNSPGPSFEVIHGVPINVTWLNDISVAHMFAVDPTLHWSNPNNMSHMMDGMEDNMPAFPPGYPEAQSPVPLVPHVHGAEVQSTSDGNPDAWFTIDGKHGSAYSSYRVAPYANSTVFHYPNEQLPATLWYHDHALGITRINVMSGLAGFYFLKDPADTIAPLLPTGKYDMPLAIQDRTFYKNGSFYFTTEGDNPDTHPYWNPEFFGDTTMVNGKVWPNMNVDKGQYRLRLLDGSNARFYNISFSNGMPFTVIASDGGYLRSAASMTTLLMAPGERYEILVDFSSLAVGTKIVLLNSANAPFPDGDPVEEETTGKIMQFTVTSNAGPAAAVLPTILNPTLASSFPSLTVVNKTRTLVLTEVMGENGPLEILLNGVKWSAAVSELPVLGTTEDWVIINPTADTHPIHLHLTQFQLVSRQSIDSEAYFNEWMDVNGMPPIMNLSTIPAEVNPTPYLKGSPRGPDPQEQGWKDTIQMNPGEVTIIRVRYAPNDGSLAYPFDATVGPGYVWHCHILDHEDNEMMRPILVIRPT
jgi:FtsP/CotA-like multicopper oxidase with cupredoxin domain